jgi:hypothetical protein
VRNFVENAVGVLLCTGFLLGVSWALYGMIRRRQ